MPSSISSMRSRINLNVLLSVFHLFVRQFFKQHDSLTLGNVSSFFLAREFPLHRHLNELGDVQD